MDGKKNNSFTLYKLRFGTDTQCATNVPPATSIRIPTNVQVTSILHRTTDKQSPIHSSISSKRRSQLKLERLAKEKEIQRKLIEESAKLHFEFLQREYEILENLIDLECNELPEHRSNNLVTDPTHHQFQTRLSPVPTVVQSFASMTGNFVQNQRHPDPIVFQPQSTLSVVHQRSVPIVTQQLVPTVTEHSEQQPVEHPLVLSLPNMVQLVPHMAHHQFVENSAQQQSSTISMRQFAPNSTQQIPSFVTSSFQQYQERLYQLYLNVPPMLSSTIQQQNVSMSTHRQYYTQMSIYQQEIVSSLAIDRSYVANISYLPSIRGSNASVNSQQILMARQWTSYDPQINTQQLPSNRLLLTSRRSISAIYTDDIYAKPVTKLPVSRGQQAKTLTRESLAGGSVTASSDEQMDLDVHLISPPRIQCNFIRIRFKTSKIKRKGFSLSKLRSIKRVRALIVLSNITEKNYPKSRNLIVFRS